METNPVLLSALSMDSDIPLYSQLVSIVKRNITAGTLGPGELLARLPSVAGTTCTNVAFGGPERRTLYITESLTGTVLMADLPNPGA